jgi:hypothetical protein
VLDERGWTRLILASVVKACRLAFEFVDKIDEVFELDAIIRRVGGIFFIEGKFVRS